MATTGKGLAYPSVSAAPNVPADIQALAESVDARYALAVANAAALSGITSPYKGMRVHLDDTDEVAVYDGSAWTGYWDTYTPSLTNLTLGNGSRLGRYLRVGKTIHFRVQITGGSTTAATGAVAIGLPVAAHGTGIQRVPVSAYIGSVYVGILDIAESATSGVVYLAKGTNGASSTVTAFGNGNSLIVEGTYEAA